MRSRRPSDLSPSAQAALVDLLRVQGVPKPKILRAIDRLSWISQGLIYGIVDGQDGLVTFAGGQPGDPAQPDREMLTDIDRVIRSLRWRDEGGVDWLSAKHPYSWYHKKLTPLLEELRADIMLSIQQWTDQEARTAAYLEERAKDRQKTKPRKIMAIAEAAAAIWVQDLGLEPRRSDAFQTFLNLATEPVRDAAGLGPITDRQLDRLVPRLRTKFNMPSSGGRPRKPPRNERRRLRLIVGDHGRF